MLRKASTSSSRSSTMKFIGPSLNCTIPVELLALRRWRMHAFLAGSATDLAHCDAFRISDIFLAY
jgi:hypothetical protein